MAEKSSKFSNLLVLMEQSTLKKFIREIQFAGFVAMAAFESFLFCNNFYMHSKAATCFVFWVELEKLALKKILTRRFETCLE